MSNEEVDSLKGVVKSDLSVDKGCTLFEGSRERSRERETIRELHRPQGRLYVVLCSRGGLLGESPTIAN